jgi:hypothetical protein
MNRRRKPPKPDDRRRERETAVGEPTAADAASPKDADYISGEALRRRLIEALG